MWKELVHLFLVLATKNLELKIFLKFMNSTVRAVESPSCWLVAERCNRIILKDNYEQNIMKEQPPLRVECMKCGSIEKFRYGDITIRMRVP